MSANPTPAALPRPDDLAPGRALLGEGLQGPAPPAEPAIPHDLLKELHRKSPARHLAIAARQFLMLLAASAVAWNFPQPWIWIPAALVSGWTVFNFTVLLHDALHHAVFNGPHPRGDRFLAPPLRRAVGHLRARSSRAGT